MIRSATPSFQKPTPFKTNDNRREGLTLILDLRVALLPREEQDNGSLVEDVVRCMEREECRDLVRTTRRRDV